MKCSHCSYMNDPDARFCENCGRPLERSCPNCGRPASPVARFCKHCGYDLTGPAPSSFEPHLDRGPVAASVVVADRSPADGPGVVGERKLVTALFSDVVGSTALAAAMDPEDWREVVSGAHQRVSQAVYRYEGTVAQLLGDGVLAFFGAPLAHEDDAERAVHAALDILVAIRDYSAQLRQSGVVDHLQVRIGLNTGLVVAGNVGSDLHREYLAVGDTVNVAARMQSAADPGSVMIAEDTRRAVAGLFDLADRGKIEVKGKAEPVHVYKVLGRRAGAVRPLGVAGLVSPLVAREREFATLLRLSADLRLGRGGLVSLVGDAGLGKTRLLDEWQAALRADVGVPVRIVTAHCLSYGGSVAYSLSAQLLRGLVAAPAGATEEETRAALWRSCRTLLGDEGQEVALFLGHMLGLTAEEGEAAWVKYLDGPGLQTRYVAAWRRLLEAMAQREPTLLIVDDLQWADPSSVQLGLQLLPVTAQVPLVIALAVRPERDSAGWKLVASAREVPGAGALELHLAPLTEADSRLLVDNLLDRAALPEPVRRLILAKAEGNPFYIEEVLRMWIDRGLLARREGHWGAVRDVDELEIPGTLQGILMARIDRLPDEAKQVLQVASVIGRQFQAGVLERVLAGRRAASPSKSMNDSQLLAQLARLQAADLIRPAGAEPEYAFKHGLVQEVVYESLLRSQRSELHGRVAEAIEELSAGRAEERAAVLAQHYERAGRNAKAFQFSVLAADNARRRYAHQEALGFYDRALVLAQGLNDPGLTDQVRAVYAGRGRVWEVAGDNAAAEVNYRQMLDLFERAGSLAGQADALNHLVTVRILTGGGPELSAQQERALALAQQVGDPLLVSRALWSQGLALRFHDPLRAVALLRQALVTLQGLETAAAHELAATVMLDLSVGMVVMGRLSEALDSMDQAEAALRQLDNRPLLTDTLGGGGWVRHMRGETAEARAKVVEGLRVSHEIGNPWGVVYNEGILQLLESAAGNLEQVLVSADRRQSLARSLGFAAFEGLNLMLTSGALLTLGQPKRGLELAQQSWAAFQRAGEPVWLTFGAGILGHALLASGEVKRAGAVLEPVWHGGEAEPAQMEGYTVAASAIAEWALAAGRFDYGLRFCDWIVGFFEAEQGRRVVGELLHVRGRMHHSRGDLPAAEADLRRARELLAGAEVRTWVWRVDAALAALHAARGDSSAAEEHRWRGAGLVQELGNRIGDPLLRAAFLAQPEVHALIGGGRPAAGTAKAEER